jgi:hypothetical protein
MPASSATIVRSPAMSRRTVGSYIPRRPHRRSLKILSNPKEARREMDPY